METESSPAPGNSEWRLSTAPLAVADLPYAVEMPELAELDGLLAPGFGGTFAVGGEQGCGKSTLLSQLAARRGAVTARVFVHRETPLLEVLHEIALGLSRGALGFVEAMPRPEVPQGWHNRARRQLFAPLYWTVRGLRALSVSLFSLIAIAFVVAQIAPDAIERPLGWVGGLAADRVEGTPPWVWLALVVAGIAIFISLRLQRRLDRQVDEAVGDLTEWIPDQRVRSWLGAEPDGDAEHLAGTARRLSVAVIMAQQVTASRRSQSALTAQIGLLRWQTGPSAGDTARVATLAGATEEISLLVRQIAKVARSLILLEGAGAELIAPSLGALAGLPKCDIVVEGDPSSADGRVMVGPWPASRLLEMLQRRAPDGVEVPAWAVRSAAESAGGNPREAIRRLRLALSATEVLPRDREVEARFGPG